MAPQKLELFGTSIGAELIDTEYLQAPIENSGKLGVVEESIVDDENKITSVLLK